MTTTNPAFPQIPNQQTPTTQTEQETLSFKPQPGPQEMFLSSTADIAIFGGSAGGGKSHALLLEALRHRDVQGFDAVIFRRTSPEIRQVGGLWESVKKLYAPFEPNMKESTLEIKFQAGATVKFAHMEHESTMFNYQGAQIAMVGFDELTHFSKSQFFYMLSRNRSVCGVKPYVRATCNPDPDSFVRELIAWWLDKEGYPIPDRSGVLRWFVRIGDELVWATDPKELMERYPNTIPKSLTFIPSKIYDNQIMMKKDPGYLANLLSLPLIERQKLLDGNWNAKASGGIFSQDWVRYYDPEKKPQFAHIVDSIDSAYGEDEVLDPSVDITFGTTLDHYIYVLDCKVAYLKFPSLRKWVKDSVFVNGSHRVLIESKATGKSLQQELETDEDFMAMIEPIIPVNDKITRAVAVTTMFEQGRVLFPVGKEWVEDYLRELLSFPNSRHDDRVDATSQFISWYMRKFMKKEDLMGDNVPVVATGGSHGLPRGLSSTSDFEIPLRASW